MLVHNIFYRDTEDITQDISWRLCFRINVQALAPVVPMMPSATVKHCSKAKKGCMFLHNCHSNTHGVLNYNTYSFKTTNGNFKRINVDANIME